MSYTISKEIEFDAGHRVPLHSSKCKNPHGHRYRVVAYVAGELITEGPESGMVRDFGIVKEVLTKQVHDVYDHSFIVYQLDKPMMRAFGLIYDPETSSWNSPYGWKINVVNFIPTAENLAKSIFESCKEQLPNLLMIEVWETPTSCARYEEDLVYETKDPFSAIDL